MRVSFAKGPASAVSADRYSSVGWPGAVCGAGPLSHDQQEFKFGTGAGAGGSSQRDGNVSQVFRNGRGECAEGPGPVCVKPAAATPKCRAGTAGGGWTLRAGGRIRRWRPRRVHANVQFAGTAAGCATDAATPSRSARPGSPRAGLRAWGGISNTSREGVAGSGGAGGRRVYAHLRSRRDAVVRSPGASAGGDAQAGSAVFRSVKIERIFVAGLVGFRVGGGRLYPVFQYSAAAGRALAVRTAVPPRTAAGGRRYVVEE